MDSEDCRHQSYIDYNLSDVCIIIMSITLCEIDTLKKILVYEHGKLDFFKEKFWIEKITSKPTLCRILRMLDVVFSEDECSLQDEEAQLTMNSFRKLALALHKNYVKQKGSISSNMLQCMIDNAFLVDLISNL